MTDTGAVCSTPAALSGRRLVVVDWVNAGAEEGGGRGWQREIVPAGRGGEIGGVALTEAGIMYGETRGGEPSIEAVLISGEGMVGVWVINSVEEAEENSVIRIINFKQKQFGAINYKAMFDE